MGNYTYTNTKNITYFLNAQEVQLRSKTTRLLYFFSKDQRDTACELPAGRVVVENSHTGLPLLKKVG